MAPKVNFAAYGCTPEQWAIVRGDPKVRFGSSPVQRWLMQKLNAGKRRIGWELSLWDWWTIWQESGKWEQRGCRSNQYVMCRKGDIGPYSKGNVYIATARQNLQDGFLHAQPRKVAPKPAGWGKGYYLSGRSKVNPYRAEYRGRYLGSFPTEEAARAAYLAACG